MLLQNLEEAWVPVKKTDLANLTHQWFPSDSEENYIAKGNMYLPDSFNYVYNECGYRCDSMKNPEQHPIRVLLAGCSMTVGIGLPYQETWGYKVIKMLEEEFNTTIPYWNVAHGGMSADYNSRILWQEIPRLKPHLVLFLTPPSSRGEIVIDDKWYLFLSGFTKGMAGIPHKELIKLFSDEAQFYNLNKNLALMQSTCEANGSEFMWNCSMSPHLYTPQKDNIGEFDERLKSRHFDGEFDSSGPLSRDSMHPGPMQHTRFADQAFASIATHLRNHLK